MIARSLDAYVRQAVAAAIEDRDVLDVQKAAEAIARTYGGDASIPFIAAYLAEAAIAARVPVKLPASDAPGTV